MIEKFTLEEFEKVLNNNTKYPEFKNIGLISGEYRFKMTYLKFSIFVNSSIGYDKVSADVGKNSIRVWVLTPSGKPLAKKQKWVTREPGWEKRLISLIYKDMIKLISKTPICPSCNGVMIKRKGKFGEFYGCENYPNCKETMNIK